MKEAQLNFDGDLITVAYKEGDKPLCLGYLLSHNGAVYEPSGGRMDGITEDQAVRHNIALDEAMLEGLDALCEIGQGTVFYLTGTDKAAPNVSTWIGTLVGTAHRAVNTKATYVFERKGRTFRGTCKQGLGSHAFFKRVA